MLWLGAIVAIGVLIVVHESGHYVVARWCKMRVDKFSLGFGPAIFGWQRGDTRFQVAPIPFGGYVQINGMLVADEVEDDDPFAYPNRPAWQRFVTIFAGPGTNYLFAIVLAFILFFFAGVETGTKWYVIQDSNKNFDAHSKFESGELATGDRILRVRRLVEEPIYFHSYGPEPRGIDAIVADAEGKPLALRVLRDGRAVEVEVTAKAGADDSYDLGLTLEQEPADVPGASTPYVVAGTAEGFDVHGKLHLGDELVSVRRVLFDEPLYFSYAGKLSKSLSDYVQEAQGSSIQLIVERDGVELEPVEITPHASAKETRKDGTAIYRVGLNLRFLKERRDAGFITTVGHALWYPVAQTRRIVDGLRRVISGDEKGALMGPVGITGFIKESIAAGWIPVLELLMVLNVYLGLFNLFPLPALDGGRLVFLSYEMATRRRANPKVEATVHMVGIMALLVIMVLVTYKDIARLL